MATASRSSVSGSLRRSVEMEEVEDEDSHSSNIPPSNASRFIESSDENDNNEDEFVGGKRARASSVINIDDGSSEGAPAVEETDEAERGRIMNLLVIDRMLTSIQIASRKTGTHQSMRSSTLFHPSTTLETQHDVFMSSSATQSLVRVKA